MRFIIKMRTNSSHFEKWNVCRCVSKMVLEMNEIFVRMEAVRLPSQAFLFVHLCLFVEIYVILRRNANNDGMISQHRMESGISTIVVLLGYVVAGNSRMR